MKKIVISLLFVALALGFTQASQAYQTTGEKAVAQSASVSSDSATSSEDTSLSDRLKELFGKMEQALNRSSAKADKADKERNDAQKKVGAAHEEVATTKQEMAKKEEAFDETLKVNNATIAASTAAIATLKGSTKVMIGIIFLIGLITFVALGFNSYGSHKVKKALESAEFDIRHGKNEISEAVSAIAKENKEIIAAVKSVNEKLNSGKTAAELDHSVKFLETQIERIPSQVRKGMEEVNTGIAQLGKEIKKIPDETARKVKELTKVEIPVKVKGGAIWKFTPPIVDNAYLSPHVIKSVYDATSEIVCLRVNTPGDVYNSSVGIIKTYADRQPEEKAKLTGYQKAQQLVVDRLIFDKLLRKISS